MKSVENILRYIRGQFYRFLKGNHCILRIQGAPVRQKLDMILENKAIQKLKLEKKVFLQKIVS